jgi:hypothetical protein
MATTFELKVAGTSRYHHHRSPLVMNLIMTLGSRHSRFYVRLLRLLLITTSTTKKAEGYTTAAGEQGHTQSLGQSSKWGYQTDCYTTCIR